MNEEYEQLISKFYDLSIEEKKEELYGELEKMKSILGIVSSFSRDPVSGKLVSYDSSNCDSEDQNLTKIYHDIMMIQEALIFYLKDKGY